MLAILSDLHLTDGTVATTAHASAFDLLRREIELAARSNDAQELRLVLLGDIFDVMRTDWWFENAAWETRPWNGKLDPQTAMNSDRAEVERQFNAILSRIFAHPTTVAFLKAVRKLAASKAIPKLKVTYVIGNHGVQWGAYAPRVQRPASRRVHGSRRLFGGTPNRVTGTVALPESETNRSERQ